MKCHSCGEIYEYNIYAGHVCKSGYKRYYIQCRNKTSLEHVPHRQTIVAKNLAHLADIIDKKMIQDQIDILDSEVIS